jgi:uroporphyrinogen-III decarboxylase
MMGPTQYFLASKTNPGLLHSLLRIITDCCIEWINWRIRHFGGPMPVLDLGDDYAAYFSPDAFDEFVLPYTGAIMNAFPDAYNMWHSDGDFTPHNLHKVNDLNIDMFNAFTPNLDIGYVRQVLEPRIALAGNVHPIKTMVFGRPPDVLREARRCIELAGKRGPFVLCPGGGVGAGTRLENVDALIQASLEYSCLIHEKGDSDDDHR